jgi:hypothetical protein
MGLYYGPPKEGYPNGFPTMCPTIPGKSMIYLHVIKERFGKPRIISCVEQFSENKILEYNLYE